MKRLALVAFASGLAGALLGAVFGAWAVRNEPRADDAPERGAPDDAAIERRVAAIEAALASIQPRPLPALTANADPEATREVGALASAAPVLEATVIDLVGKPAPVRDVARAAPRSRVAGDRYWAQELTMQLGLTPAQTERLRSIHAELQQNLEHAESAATDKRHAARRASRRDAEHQLRAALAPRQLVAYEALDARLKLDPAGAD